MKLDVDGGIRNRNGNYFGISGDAGSNAFYGGSDYNQGAGIVLYGDSHATDANIIKFTNGAFVERMRIDSAGNVGIGTTPSYRLHATQSASVDTVWFSNTNGSFGGTLIRGDATRAANSGYYFMGFTSSAGADNEFLFRGDGNAFADGAWGGGGADYAEYFEWADGNPSSEDRRGYSVSLVGNKIKIAEPGETVIGVISGNPSVIGDSFPETREKYLVDDFGSYVKDKDGKRVKNPKFKKVANRKSRDKDPMFSAVGLMGKLRVRKGQEVDPRWIKMRDISPTIEEWLVR